MNPDSAMKTASALIPFIVLLMTCKTTVAGGHSNSYTFYRDSILVRILQYKKPIAFGLYPDAYHEVLLFTAKGDKGKVYQLFLFDITGNLVRQVQVRSKETSLLSNLVKGDYIFEVLSDDERIGNGGITVR